MSSSCFDSNLNEQSYCEDYNNSLTKTLCDNPRRCTNGEPQTTHQIWIHDVSGTQSFGTDTRVTCDAHDDAYFVDASRGTCRNYDEENARFVECNDGLVLVRWQNTNIFEHYQGFVCV